MLSWAMKHRVNLLQALAAGLALIVAASFLLPFPLPRRGFFEWVALAVFMASFF